MDGKFVSPRGKAMATLLALALAISGCGGGGGDAAPPPIGGGPNQPPPAPEADLAITNVTLVPMDGSGRQGGMTVRVRGKTIFEIGPSNTTDADAARVIDATGKVLLPGMIDAHVHVYEDHELPLFPANGITTVRNMWGTPGIFPLRQRVASGAVLGPEIVTSGPITDGDPPFWPGSAVARTEAEGRNHVRQHRNAGYDFIKIYFRLSEDAYRGVREEAAAQGMRYAGHVPRSVGTEEIYGSAIWSVEHLDGYLTAIINPASGYDPANPNTNLFFQILRDIRAGDRPFSDLFRPDERARLAQVSDAGNTAHVPTVTLWQQRYLSRAEQNAFNNRAEMRFIHPDVRAEWRQHSNDLFARFTDEEVELLRFQQEEDFRILADLAAANVPVLVGTDARNPYVMFGFAIHDELALFVRASFTPRQAMEAATIRAAEFLGLQASIGSVAVGKEADLVLYDADPTVDIGNSRAIAAVVIDGEYLTRAQLDAELEQVANSF